MKEKAQNLVGAAMIAIFKAVISTTVGALVSYLVVPFARMTSESFRWEYLVIIAAFTCTYIAVEKGLKLIYSD